MRSLPTLEMPLRVAEHPAVLAWAKLHPDGHLPEAVETVHQTHKSAIYRLRGFGTNDTLIAKRCVRKTGRVEQLIYAEVLPVLPVSALRYYGSVADPDLRFCWMFLEDAGVVPYDPENVAHGKLLTDWVAALHSGGSRFAAVGLPDRGPRHYQQQLQAARRRIRRCASNPVLTGQDLEVLEGIIWRLNAVESSWQRVEALCRGLPQTVVHADLKAKNIRLQPDLATPRVLVFDWETSGWGIPAPDLVFCADLARYHGLVRHRWPGVSFERVQLMAQIGLLFRTLAAVEWETWRLPFDNVRRPITNLRDRYSARLDQVIQTLLGGSQGTPARLTSTNRMIRTTFPCRKAMISGLSRVLGNSVTFNPRLVVLKRRPLRPQMTSPVEIVTCRWPPHQRLNLFCKYQPRRCHRAHGHRGGLAYEAAIYRKLLQSLPASTPKFYGTCRDAAARQFWLILGFLKGGKLLRDVVMDTEAGPQPTALGLAARWAGRFHALTGVQLARAPASFLHRYDADYYLGWVRRTWSFAETLRPRYPGVERLYECARDWLAPLLTAPPVIIHGEYYENNIMVCERKIFPTDWESAAVAAGEIDLAALTEGNGWSPKVVKQCLNEYQRTRWPDGTPADFPATLQAARLYLHFRWLGERQDLALAEKNRWRFEALEKIAQELGLA